MRDTAELGTAQKYIKDIFFKREDLLSTIRSWGSFPSLFPKGGDAIWGYRNQTKGRMVTFDVERYLEDSLKELHARFNHWDDNQDGIVHWKEVHPMWAAWTMMRMEVA